MQVFLPLGILLFGFGRLVFSQEPVINPNEPSGAQDSTKEGSNPMDPGDFRTPQNTQDPLPQNIPPEGSVPIDSAEVTDQGVFDPFLNPSGPGAPPIPLFDPFKEDPSQFDPNGPQGGPPGQPFNPNAPGGPGGPADPFANLQPVAASALGAGGNPSLQPVAASALGAGGNPSLQPVAASSLGATGSPSGAEAAPENCPPPVTCDKGQISCPTEAPKPGSICLPPLKCIDRRETCFFNPDRPFDSNAPEGFGGPTDPFASLQPVPASTLGAGGNPSLKPIPASALGAGGNPSLKPVAASTLGAGGNPSLQPVAASIQGDPSKPIAASSSGDSGLLSGPEAAPETCPPPVTCGPGQITCPTSFPKPGSTCPPPLKCIEMNEKGPNGQFCPGYCPTICTEESQSCPGNVGRDGCNRPGICISKEAFCPVTCEADEIPCPAAFNFETNQAEGPGTCVPNMIKGPDGQDCPGICPPTCGKDEKICPSTPQPDGCAAPDKCISNEESCQDTIGNR